MTTYLELMLQQIEQAREAIVPIEERITDMLDNEEIEETLFDVKELEAILIGLEVTEKLMISLEERWLLEREVEDLL